MCFSSLSSHFFTVTNSSSNQDALLFQDMLFLLLFRRCPSLRVPRQKPALIHFFLPCLLPSCMLAFFVLLNARPTQRALLHSSKLPRKHLPKLVIFHVLVSLPLTFSRFCERKMFPLVLDMFLLLRASERSCDSYKPLLIYCHCFLATLFTRPVFASFFSFFIWLGTEVQALRLALLF